MALHNFMASGQQRPQLARPVCSGVGFRAGLASTRGWTAFGQGAALGTIVLAVAMLEALRSGDRLTVEGLFVLGGFFALPVQISALPAVAWWSRSRDERMHWGHACALGLGFWLTAWGLGVLGILASAGMKFTTDWFGLKAALMVPPVVLYIVWMASWTAVLPALAGHISGRIVPGRWSARVGRALLGFGIVVPSVIVAITSLPFVVVRLSSPLWFAAAGLGVAALGWIVLREARSAGRRTPGAPHAT